MTLRTSSAITLLAGALLIAPAIARAQSDAERCAAIVNNSDQAIPACTRAIESGKLSGEPLARLYYKRGNEWSSRGTYDRAISDYDEAIRVYPKLAEAHYGRGSAWSSKGESDKAIADYDAAARINPKDASPLIGRAVELTLKGDYVRAIADYDAAIALDANSAMSFLGRGRARFYNGDYARSVPDFEQALKRQPNGYTAMWLYFSRKRVNAYDAEEKLESEAASQRGTSWPGPLITLFLGRTDVESVQAAASDRNARKQAEQRCEANFYLAEWHLLRGERERALPLLKEAQSGCPNDYIEHEGTVAELRRLTR